MDLAHTTRSTRSRFLADLAGEILGLYGRGRTIVAIDGTDAAARAAFADDLAAALAVGGHGQAVFRSSLDAFTLSAEEQARFGSPSPDRLYRHRYDLPQLRQALLDPFRRAGESGFAAREVSSGTGAAADATLVVDGEYLNRPELRDLWSYSVLVEATPDPDGTETPGADLPGLDQGSLDKYGADQLYRREAGPRGRATTIVDVANPLDPRTLFFDSC